MTEPHVMWLTEPAAAQAGVTGGCGSTLARLTQAGFPVPTGYVVTTEAYRGAVEAAGVGDELRRLASTAVPEDSAALDELAVRLYTAATALHPPDELAATVVDAHHRLGASTPVAVCSSALTAGEEHVVFCWVHGHEMVLRRLHDCWASLWTSQAVAARAEREVEGEPSTAVVVQAMVDADRAGVATTDEGAAAAGPGAASGTGSGASAGDAAGDAADDLGGGQSTIEVRAVRGLGEAVVSGEVEPDVYFVEASTLTVARRHVGQQDFALRRECDGGTAHVPLPPAQATAPVLDGRQVRRVAALARAVARHYGAPVDVQWALDGDELWLLHARTRPWRRSRPAGRHSGRPAPQRADRDRGVGPRRPGVPATATSTSTTGPRAGASTAALRRHRSRRPAHDRGEGRGREGRDGRDLPDTTERAHPAP